MKLTEKEAKERWCPMVRYLAIFRAEDGRRETAGSYNRGAQDSALGNAHCVASDCMMWRQIPYDPDLHSPHRNREPLPRRGYCGLAGKPEGA